MNRCKNCRKFKNLVNTANPFCFSCANRIIWFVIEAGISFRSGKELIEKFLLITENLKEKKEHHKFMNSVQKQMASTEKRLRQRLIELGFEALMKD